MLGKIDEDKVSRLLIDNIARIHYTYEQLKKINKLPSSLHPGGPCLAGVHRLFVSVDGVFFPCERVSETSEVMKIGDIENGIDIAKVNIINNIGLTTEDKCKKCWSILHCRMCALYSDNLNEFSQEKRLKRCDVSKYDVEVLFQNIVFLKMYGYDFERKIIK